MILPKEGSEVAKQFVLILLSAKASLTFVNQLGIPTLPSTDPAKCTAGWMLAIPEGFFQLHGLISRWQCPSKWAMQRLVHRERHLLLTMLVIRAGLLLTQDKKLYILLFPSCITFFKDFHACQLAGTQALVLTLTQAKAPANPNFLLFVTSPTAAQETQSLKTQGLPSVRDERCILGEHEMCLSGYQTFFFPSSWEHI